MAANDAEMKAFCESIGEIILWASAIDAQLTKAVIAACSLTESPMLEPIVAELDARAKIEILRARVNNITPTDWPKGIKTWLDKAEKANSYRNLVAHHQVATIDGELALFSQQARKLLKSIKNIKPAPAKNIGDINQWVKAARHAYGQGQNVLANLDRFAEEVSRRKAR